jgi:hypothetical protein
MWVASSPRIVAESLAVVGRLPTTRRGAPRPATARTCLALARGAHAPAMSARTPPPWLRPEQHASWRRTVAAIEGWGTAILAEPVGTGKTWIALAVAHALGERVVIVVPAVLQVQWRDACARSGVEASLHTLERMSRGHLPPSDARLVIVDEAHRLRDPATRRGRLFARWALGRRLLFLTGTPVVNRAGDLLMLLRYGLARDALRLDGVPDLEALADADTPPAALRRLVIRAVATPAIAARRRCLPLDAAERSRGNVVVALLGEVRLAEDPGTRRLIQSVLLDAAASSDAAWRAALKRYRALLAQAEDAGHLDRATLRRWAGEALEQTVLWTLLPPAGHPDDAVQLCHDRAWIDRALAAPTDDLEWISAVQARCADGGITVCFARHRATAAALRTALGDGVAWVEGPRAGIGPHRLPREVVLAGFGPERDTWQSRRVPPTVLIATDVAAEGLNLQAANRIVHLDMPWTPMRRDQRDGRVRRLGQLAAEVELWHRAPAPAIETVLALWRGVRRKSRTSRRWLRVLSTGDRPQRIGAIGCCLVVGDGEGPEVVVALRLREGQRTGTLVLARHGGAWRPASWPVRADPAPVSAGDSEVTLRHAERLLPEAMAAATRLVGTTVPAAAHRLARIQRLARIAARLRDREALAALDAWLRLARSSGAAGMTGWWDDADRAPDATWCRMPAIMPPAEHPLVVQPIAVALFQSPGAALR